MGSREELQRYWKESENLKKPQQELSSLNNMEKTEKFNSNRELQDNNKRSNIIILGVPEIEDKKCGAEKYLKKYWLKISKIWQKA